MQRLRAAFVYVEHLELGFIRSTWKPLQIWAQSQLGTKPAGHKASWAQSQLQCLWQLRAPYYVDSLLTPVDGVGCKDNLHL